MRISLHKGWLRSRLNPQLFELDERCFKKCTPSLSSAFPLLLKRPSRDEGHLALMSRLKTEGYQIHIFFLSLTSVELALSRVRERVSRGGHDVPEKTVRRRFDRSMRNFLERYRRLADTWTLFDNSGKSPATVALAKGGEVRIINRSIHSALVRRYGGYE